MRGIRRLTTGSSGRARDESGVALVEFALVLPLLAILLFGIIDFGRAFSFWINETQIASEAARWAVVNKNPGATEAPSLSFPEYVAQRAVTEELRDSITVSVCFPADTNAKGDPVRVSVSAPFTFMSLIAGGVTRNITATATMRLEQQPTEAGVGPEVAYAGGC